MQKYSADHRTNLEELIKFISIFSPNQQILDPNISFMSNVFFSLRVSRNLISTNLFYPLTPKKKVSVTRFWEFQIVRTFPFDPDVFARPARKDHYTRTTFL